VAKGQLKARVQCTIEIPVGVWGSGTTDLDALTEQVRKEGFELVQKMAREQKGFVIGHPKVLFYVMSEE
jgi:hypothetical protein